MPTYQEILTRGQQSVGVWEFFAPTLTFGTLALAPSKTDVEAMAGADQAVVNAEAVIDDKRDVRDVKVAIIKEIATRLPRLAASVLAPDDGLQDDILQLQGIVMDSLESTLDRGRATITLWNGVNARRAAATPALPALTLPKAGGGVWTVADLAAAVPAVDPLEQDVKDAAAPLSAARSARRALATRVDRANKRWYEAWAAHFPVGTPEHDALSQITTEGGGGGDTGNGEPPAPALPAAPSGVSFTQGNEGDPVEGNAAANLEAILWKAFVRPVGSSEEPVLIASGATLPLVFTHAPGEYEFTMTVTTAAGESAPSAPVTLTVA